MGLQSIRHEDAGAAPGRQAVPFETLGRLIQRMWLYPGEAAPHRPAYDVLVRRMIAGSRSAASKAELLRVVCHVNRREYLQALAALRAIAS
jgi:hypothetical protein